MVASKHPAPCTNFVRLRRHAVALQVVSVYPFSKKADIQPPHPPYGPSACSVLWPKLFIESQQLQRKQRDLPSIGCLLSASCDTQIVTDSPLQSILSSGGAIRVLLPFRRWVTTSSGAGGDQPGSVACKQWDRA